MPIIQEGGGEILIEGGGSLLQEGESEFTNMWIEAWEELYEAQTESFNGDEQTITVGDTEDIPAIIEAVPRDQVYVDGGVAERQQFRIQIKATSLVRAEPRKIVNAVTFTPHGSLTEYSGAVLNVESNNGIFYLSVGDPNAID